MRRRSILLAVCAIAALVVAGVSLSVLADEAPKSGPKAIPDHIRPHLNKLSSPDQRERVRAEEALVQIGKQAVTPLIELMRTAGGAERRVAARVLGKIGRPAVRPLIAALPHDSEPVRTDFANALSMVGVEAVDLLIPGIMDRNVHIRWGSAIALGEIGDRRAVAPLIEGLRDKTWKSRMCTAMALGKMGDPAAVDALIEQMNDKTWPLRWSAVQALGTIGDARAAAPLVRLLTDPDAAVSRDCTRALTQLGPKAVGALLSVLSGKDEKLRRQAAEILTSIKDPRSDKALRKYYEEIRARERALQVEASNVVLNSASRWRVYFVFRPAEVEVEGVVKPVLSGVADRLHGETPPPAENWTETGFDDSGWLRGPAGIVVRTPFLSRLCMRGKFTVTNPAEVKGLSLSMEYHGGAVITLNGKEIVRGHLPPGRDRRIAASYPDEAFFTADGGVLTRPDLRKGAIPDNTRRRSLRKRALSKIPIPSSRLREGVNVLAIEVVRSPYHRLVADGKGPFGFGFLRRAYSSVWSTCAILDVRMKAEIRRGLLTNTVRPEGFQIWNSDLLASDFDMDYGDPNEPLQAINIVGAKNGSFCGKVVVGSTAPIRGLKGIITHIAGPQGVIGPESLKVRYGVPWGLDASLGWYWSGPANHFGMLWDKPDAVIPVRQQGSSPRGSKPLAGPKPILGAVCPIWLTVSVPASTRPGSYTGQLRILAENEKSRTVPVSLTVEDYALPDPQDYRTWFELIQSPDTLAVEYGVNLWSPKHFDLMARSMAHLKAIGSRVLYVPLICHTNLGNAESMIRWIPKPTGGYRWDFSVMERYIDTARVHMGNPKIICFNVWDVFFMPKSRMRSWDHPSTLSARDSLKGKGPVVTMLGPATGRAENRFLPPYSDPAVRGVWKSLFKELRRRLSARGLEKTMMLGMATDWIPTREEFDFFGEIAPGLPWVSHSHGIDRSRQLRGFKESGYRVEMGYATTVYAVGFSQSAEKGSRYGWRNSRLHAQFPRGSHRFDTYPTTTWRHIGEMNVTGNQRGVGHMGADFWHAIKDKRGRRRGRVCARYPQSSWTNLNIETSLLAPGPDGACATTRFEIMREGIQECEARIQIEMALSDKEMQQRLGDELKMRCQEALDERMRFMLQGVSSLRSRSGWSNFPGVAGHLWFVGSGWQERTRKLYALAGEVQKKLKAR